MIRRGSKATGCRYTFHKYVHEVKKRCNNIGEKKASNLLPSVQGDAGGGNIEFCGKAGETV